MLFSEPGLGKSLFARILAKACGVPLVAYSVADLFASSPGYLDSVIKASRQMFERAAAIAPCILFLDEIDALPNRATMSPRGADWWTSVITDFLLSLDNAVAGKRAGIVVVAATNNIKGVDAAILRPGRLERAIEIQRPDYGGTVNILCHHVNGALTDADIGDVAHLLEGATGAEIMMAVRGARRIARYGGRPLKRDDLLQAIAPPEDMPHATLNRICIHEAAHAVAAIVARSGVVKRCIVGGAGAAGHTLIWTDPHEMPTRDSVERRAVVLLCGQTAEQHIIGDAALGAGGEHQSDLARATQLVATLHASAGLGDTLTYLVSHEEALTAVREDRELRSTVELHLRALQVRADELVCRYRDAIIAIADQLSTRRQLSGDEVRRIFDAMAPHDQTKTASHRYPRSIVDPLLIAFIDKTARMKVSLAEAGDNIRVRLIAAVADGAGTKATAEAMSVPYRKAKRWVEVWREAGAVATRKGGHRSKLDDHQDFLRTLVAQRPDIKLGEIHRALGQHGVKTGETAVWKALERFHITLANRRRPARSANSTWVPRVAGASESRRRHGLCRWLPRPVPRFRIAATSASPKDR